VSVAAALLLWAAVVCLPAAGRAQTPAPDALVPFGWLRDLAGACWRGQGADGKAADTQCYETQYGHFLRGTIAMVIEAPAKPVIELRGDSVWAWDVARNRFALTTWASNGTITASEAWFEGDAVVFPVPRRDGGEATSRTRWQRIDADSFRGTRQRREGAAWLDGQSLTYRRVR
jgi:hypothetical protein